MTTENSTCRICKIEKTKDEFYKKPYSGTHFTACKSCILQSRKNAYVKRKSEKIYQTRMKELEASILEELKNNIINSKESLLSQSKKYGIKYHYLQQWVKADYNL